VTFRGSNEIVPVVVVGVSPSAMVRGAPPSAGPTNVVPDAVGFPPPCVTGAKSSKLVGSI
jgi:hypothetical protein